jgi:hypothetical protein
MVIHMRFGSKFVAGTAVTGRIVLERSNGSTAELPGLVIVRGVSLTDNDDSTFTLVFDGS